MVTHHLATEKTEFGVAACVTVATIGFDRTCRELRGAYFTEAKEPETCRQ